MTAGGIVLCGGKSTRMGRSKALLPFGPETMLQRVVRLLGSVVQPIDQRARAAALVAVHHHAVGIPSGAGDGVGGRAALEAGSPFRNTIP